MSSTLLQFAPTSLISSAPIFENASNFTINHAIFTDQQINNHNWMHQLAQSVAHGAFHDSSVRYPPPMCHPGTRERVLRKIKDWIEENEGTTGIMWLYGSAGVGKSAIAQTIAEHCVTNDKLGAAFFFFRGDPQRNDANRLFPTLAWQLMSSVPEIKTHISASMENDHFLPKRSISTQFEQLIVEPFRLAADNNSPLRMCRIVIIDGVDECAGEAIQQCFLSLLGSAVDKGLPLRFLICSRPEPHIQEAFDHSTSIGVTSRIILNDDLDSYSDIRRYLVREFSRISTERGIASWPQKGVFDCLVQKSSGQFIYAATVVKFVGDKYTYPRKQLEIILGIRRGSNGSSPFADLDQLYLEILVRQPDQNFLKTFLNLFSLPIQDIHRAELIRILLNMEKEEFPTALRGLHSLLDITDDLVCTIRPYHASFLDFLRDQERSSQYHCDTVLGSNQFVDLFLEALLKYVSNNQQYSLSLRNKRDFDDLNVILTHEKSFRLMLKYIAVDQWEKILAPIQTLSNVTFEMRMGSLQPFKIIDWSLRLLFSSLRGKLFIRKKPNGLISLGTPSHCPPHPITSICTRCSCCNLDFILFLLFPPGRAAPPVFRGYDLDQYFRVYFPYTISVVNLKQLAEYCFQMGFSTMVNYCFNVNCYPYSFEGLRIALSDLIVAYGLDYKRWDGTAATRQESLR